MKNRLYLARDMGGDCSSLGAWPVTVLPRVALRLGSVSHGYSHFCLQHSDDGVSINISQAPCYLSQGKTKQCQAEAEMSLTSNVCLFCCWLVVNLFQDTQVRIQAETKCWQHEVIGHLPQF